MARIPDGYVNKLQMPFFYVPGNHDLANKTTGPSLEEQVRPALLSLRLSQRAVPHAQFGRSPRQGMRAKSPAFKPNT